MNINHRWESKCLKLNCPKVLLVNKVHLGYVLNITFLDLIAFDGFIDLFLLKFVHRNDISRYFATIRDLVLSPDLAV